MKKPIRIAIAEDHLLLRETLVRFFKSESSINVILDVGNGAELLSAIKNLKIEIVLLDIRMPVLDGWQALNILNERHPEIRVIIVSMHDSESYIVEGIKKGARGFLCKDCSGETLVDAIHSVHEEGFYFSKKTSKALRSKVVNNEFNDLTVLHESLSERETQIVKFICSGKTNKEIAELMFLSVRTIESHRKNISEKTKCTNVASLVVYAIKNGVHSIE